MKAHGLAKVCLFLALCVTPSLLWAQRIPAPGSPSPAPRSPAPVPPDPAPGPGAPRGEPPGVSPMALGTMLGVFLHELGHGVINEFQLPVVGPEEDVADEFAAMVFVFNMRLDPKFRELSLWTPRIWRQMGMQSEQKGEKHPWFDEHAPTMVRYGKILCVLAGAEPQAFAQEVNATIPEATRERWLFRCGRDFERKYQAWNTLLKPHRRNVNPRLPGDQPAHAVGGKMSVDYSWLEVPMASKFTREFGPLLRDSRAFDRIAEHFTRDYVLPRDLPVYVRECNVFNAWYNPSAHSISMCLNVAEEAMERLQPSGRIGPR